MILGYGAARYLLNISNPERDLKTLQRWWHYTVFPFVQDSLHALGLFAHLLHTTLFFNVDSELQKLKGRILRGDYADDTGNGGY